LHLRLLSHQCYLHQLMVAFAEFKAVKEDHILTYRSMYFNSRDDGVGSESKPVSRLGKVSDPY
jgi:hypothetical protein